MFLSFCFSSSKYNIILLLKYTCVEFISIKLLWENQIKKLENYPSLRKSYLTSPKGIGGRKKKGKISKSKATTLAFFVNLKKKQQDPSSKNWSYFGSFMPLASQISVLQCSVLKILSS